jgi:hypothetical protein
MRLWGGTQKDKGKEEGQREVAKNNVRGKHGEKLNN